MAEWLVETGIGEDRAILVEDGQIVAARVDVPGTLRAGAVIAARIASKPAGRKRGMAVADNGTTLLVDHLPASLTEGQSLLLAVTRPALAERGRFKLAQSRPAPPGAVAGPGPTLREALASGVHPVRSVRPADGRFDRAGWDELVEQAVSGQVDFAGGSLQLAPTPAMTVIDIDGTLPAAQLALAAVPALVAALARLDVGGNVGIDFPTLAEKTQRQSVDTALAAELGKWSGERTAMNGFGFVQLVARLERASLLARYNGHPERAGVQAALRRAEAVTAPGAILIGAHPVLQGHLDDRLGELARRTGRELRIEWDPALAPEAPRVQALAP